MTYFENKPILLVLVNRVLVRVSLVLVVVTGICWCRFVDEGNLSSSSGSGSTYIIGDLHGDVVCTKYWVQQTGLIDGNTNKWISDVTSILVFMGDYVDKGPTSRQTLEYVKKLTEDFPQNVVALLGNHEMELLLDADADGRRDDWNGYGYHNLVYASVHPAEYLNYLSLDDLDDDDGAVDDHLVVDALYNAALQVYGNGQYHSVVMIPDIDNSHSILNYVQPESIRPMVSHRLQLYQQRYMEHFRRHMPLGSWLQSRPILYVTQDGTLLVHGGIPIHIAAQFLSKGDVDVDKMNHPWMQQQQQQQHANNDLNSFITKTDIGQAIYTMLTYRGNHHSSCIELQRILNSMEGIHRLGVGHTPGDTVRIECNNTFLALDSVLGRWIRATGNEYCRGDKAYTSSNGKFVCDQIDPRCQGQIVQISNDDGTIHILDDGPSTSGEYYEHHHPQEEETVVREEL